MIIELTEEEREFLERVCVRASLFCKINLFHPSDKFSNFEKDAKSVQELIEKLKLEKKNDH
jgi:hypothetical protein